jgi:hypothetical protein
VWYAYFSVEAGDNLAQLFFKGLAPAFYPDNFGYCTAYGLVVGELQKPQRKDHVRFDWFDGKNDDSCSSCALTDLQMQ